MPQQTDRRYRFLLFDMDNTLMDFTAGERAALFQTMEAQNRPIAEPDYLKYRQINQDVWSRFEAGQLDSKAVQRVRFEAFASHLGLDPSEGQALNDRYVTNLGIQAVVMEGALDMLRRLRPQYGIAVVTNGLHLVQRERLRRSGFLPYLDGVFISQEMGVRKPDKAYFDAVCDALGEPDRAKYLMIGDSLSADIQGGVNAGMDTCWLRPSGAASSEAITPTYTFDGYDELIALLQA